MDPFYQPDTSAKHQRELRLEAADQRRSAPLKRRGPLAGLLTAMSYSIGRRRRRLHALRLMASRDLPAVTASTTDAPCERSQISSKEHSRALPRCPGLEGLVALSQQCNGHRVAQAHAAGAPGSRS
jgi:hypothetical protein